MTRIADWFFHLRHRLFHGEQHTHIEHGDGRVYVRCRLCGLRTDGLAIEPMKLRGYIAGDPRRFALDTTLIDADVNVTTEIEAEAQIEYYDERTRPNQRVH